MLLLRTMALKMSHMIKFRTVSGEAIILASASPRRRDILRAIGLSFTVMPSQVEEPPYCGGSVADHARLLAEMKASDVARRAPGHLVIGADTVVLVDNHILEKPRTEQEAVQMLHRLGGRWHHVLTGVCLIRSDPNRRRSGCEVTRVKFAPLGLDEIRWYVSTGEPMDKAGGYAIQGYGALFIERIEGDYLNVVGLPLRLVYHLANELGVDLKGYLRPSEDGEAA